MTDDFTLIGETHPDTRERKMETPRYEIFSSGGGTQSAAIAVLILQERLPKPDMFVIADTRREMPTTWSYMNDVVRPALRSIGIVCHRASKEKWAYQHDDLLNKKGTMLMPMFTTQSESEPGKLPNFCSTYWKQDVVDNFVRAELGVSRIDYRKWIGFSLNEVTRALRMMQGDEFIRGLIRLPLIHDVPLNRQSAISLVESFGWPTPPRSRCWMCPLQSNDEWLEVKRDFPALFRKAVALEKKLRDKDPHVWLHRDCVPLGEVDFSKADLFSRACDSGNCFV